MKKDQLHRTSGEKCQEVFFGPANFSGLSRNEAPDVWLTAIGKGSRNGRNNVLPLKIEINIDSKYRLLFLYSSQKQPRQRLGWQSAFLAVKDRITIGEPGRKITERTLAHLRDVGKKNEKDT